MSVISNGIEKKAFENEWIKSEPLYFGVSMKYKDSSIRVD